MGSKNKLRRFRENETFLNVIQPSRDEITEGFAFKGQWHSFFKNNNPITLELGCGKGEYTIALAKQHPNRNFIGVDTEKKYLDLSIKRFEELEKNIKNKNKIIKLV